MTPNRVESGEISKAPKVLFPSVIFGSEKIWSHQNFGSKNIILVKILGLKNVAIRFWVQDGSMEILSPHEYWRTTHVNTFQNVVDTSQTPNRHVANTFLHLSRHLQETLRTPSKHLSDTYQTPSR